jgi:hypothetical protein
MLATDSDGSRPQGQFGDLRDSSTPDSAGLLDRAIAASKGNPIAAAVSRRAAALIGDGAVDIRARFDAVATDLDQAGAHYEGQRARHLAATCAAIPPG